MDRSTSATVQHSARPATAVALVIACLFPHPAGAAKPTKDLPASKTPSSGKSSGSAGSIVSGAGSAAKNDKQPPPAPDLREFNPAGVLADPYPTPPGELADDLLPSEEDQKRISAFTQFALATLIEETEDADAAFGDYLKALELDPANAGLATRIAAELLRQKKTEEAVRLLKATQQAAPKEPGPAVELARIYLGILRQPDNALPFAEKAYRSAPEDLSTITALVEVCAAGRLTQRIDDTLRKTLALSTKDPAFWLRAGDLFRSALSLRGSIPGRTQIERLNKLFFKALDLAPSDPQCIERTADHFALTQQYADACRFYDRAQTILVQEGKGKSVTLCQKWARAMVLNEQGDSAVELLEEVVQQSPRAAEPRELLGELYLQQGQIVSALAHFRWALDLEGAKLEDHVRIIQLELRLKRADNAAEAAQKARARFPDAPGITMLLAVALGEAKRHSEAIKAFGEAEQEFLKTKSDALDASFYLTYGAAAERAGLTDQAVQLLKKSISLDPENAAEALNYLGFMWIDRNMNLEEAGTLIRKALGLRPNYPAYLDSLGWWHYRKGDLPAAERELRRALEKIRREEAPEVYDHLGEVLQKLGKTAEAINSWEAALELEPNLEAIRAKINKLRPAPAPAAPPPPADPPPPNTPPTSQTAPSVFHRVFNTPA